MRPIDADALAARYMSAPPDYYHTSHIVGEITSAPTVKTQGWISVKDRLPEESGRYLCWFGKNKALKGAEIVMYVDEWKAFGSLQSLETYPNVTHWMPIEPPKEVSMDGSDA